MPLSPSRYDYSKAELGDVLSELLGTVESYRVEQLWKGMYHQRLAPGDVTTFSKAHRETLSQAAALGNALTEVIRNESDGGETVKWLYQLADARQVETVLMHYDDRSTVCVSSQAGCAMACGFCATGQAGFDRHLSVGEIVEQVVNAQIAAGDRRVSNIVFMGMGEPMANFDRVWTAVERIHDDLGIGARGITISTVGVVPGIEKLATKSLPVNLAVSLHAANDDLRDELVPLNKRYPIQRLMTACEDYLATTTRRLSFEWALIDSVNDRDSDAGELAELCRGLGAHVNVIPLNPTPGYLVRGSTSERVQKFVDRLRDLGVNATVRNTRGREIDAACGQLAASNRSEPAQPGTPVAPVVLRRRAVSANS